MARQTQTAAAMKTAAAIKAAAAITRDPRWAKMAARDAQADGTFYYAVATTGVYCRPSCAAKRARPENVRFFATCGEAERAGFRPCKRCKPDEAPRPERNTAKIAAACRTIEESERVPALAELAGQAGLSRHHFHRLFKAATGLTPRDYAAAKRAERLRERLAGAGTVTEAIFDAGYGSSGRFYENADAVLGMTPGQYRAGGAKTEIRYATGTSSLGLVLAAQSERGVCAILLGADADALRRELRNRFPNAKLVPGGRDFGKTVAKAVALVEQPERGFDLPLDVRGSAFQHRVWRCLRAIPAGKTASYGEIAGRIGAPGAARAVARACAANALAVAIPCHRAVKADGTPAGYRWGVKRKRALLKKEAGG